jgi:hypothetical protein
MQKIEGKNRIFKPTVKILFKKYKRLLIIHQVIRALYNKVKPNSFCKIIVHLTLQFGYMNKAIFFIIIVISCFTSLFGQNNSALNCLVYDNGHFVVSKSDSIINCLSIAGADSKQTLDSIFLSVGNRKDIKKENIKKLEINSYTDKIIPASIKEFSNLSELVMDNCPNVNYSKLFKYISHLNKLSSLELNENGRAEPVANISKLNSLTKLSITNYDYVDADDLFNNLMLLPALKEVSISSTGEINLTSTSSIPKGLSTLELDDDGLCLLPDDISKIRGLHTIDISDNTFSDMEKVTTLIDSLPLKSFSVTCFDRKDSSLIVKTFPRINIKVTIYHELPKATVYAKSRINETNAVINNFYSKTVKAKVGNTESDRKKFTVPARQKTTLYYNSGTKLNIPEDAFVDSTGNAVKGDVDVYYREYNDIVDIFANGIPMDYDSAGQKTFFRSAGMFEIYATQGNNQVFLAPGKKISVDFAATDTISGYKLYRLDEKTGQWTYKDTLSNKVKVTKKNLSSAYRSYTSLFKMNFDTTLFDERYKDFSYVRTDRITPFISKNPTSWLGFFKIKRAYHATKDKVFKKQPNFVLDIKNHGRYKELNSYWGYTWVYNGKLSKKEFNKKYVSKKDWTDIRVSYDPSANDFNIELKSPKEFVTMEAIPIKANYKSNVFYDNTYLKLDNRYTKTLKKLQAKFDNNIKKKIEKHINRQWADIVRIMSPEEKAMSRDEWIAYAKKRCELEQDSLYKINGIAYNITRSFEIEGFGIFNCDQQLRLAHPLNIIASFKDVNDKPLKPETVYVIDKRINGVLSFNYSAFNRSIMLDPYDNSAICIIETNGTAALVDKQTIINTFLGKDSQNHYTFRAYEVNPATISTAYLRKALGME